jgi:predicted nucleic acid-binding Zn ribbon protein
MLRLRSWERLRWQIDRTQSIYIRNARSLRLFRSWKSEVTSHRADVRNRMRPGCLWVDYRVPIYIYETTDSTKPIRNFEVKQSVHDDPLRSDPETGEAARRVISAGYNLLIRGKSVGPCVGSVGSH